MRKRIYFEGLSSQAILNIMDSMLSTERCTHFGTLMEDDYEWVIGADVWDRIAYNINYCNIKETIEEKTNVLKSLYISNYSDPLNYRIFDIKVTVSKSKNELNTITLRNKIERRNELNTITLRTKIERRNEMPSIKKVIFNDPATIVIWGDGSKTVVKCQDGEFYDPEKGLAMAISKKALGNKGNYCEVFKKWLPEEKTDAKSGLIGRVQVEIGVDTAEFESSVKRLDENLRKVGKSIKKMEESLNRCDAILGE